MERYIDTIIFLVVVGVVLIRFFKKAVEKLANEASKMQEELKNRQTQASIEGNIAHNLSGMNDTNINQRQTPSRSQSPHLQQPPSGQQKSTAAWEAALSSAAAEKRKPAINPHATKAKLPQVGFRGTTAARSISRPDNGRKAKPQTPAVMNSLQAGINLRAMGEPPGERTTAQSKARRSIQIDLKNRRQLRLALLTREVIDRPRAFDV